MRKLVLFAALALVAAAPADAPEVYDPNASLTGLWFNIANDAGEVRSITARVGGGFVDSAGAIVVGCDDGYVFGIPSHVCKSDITNIYGYFSDYNHFIVDFHAWAHGMDWYYSP